MRPHVYEYDRNRVEEIRQAIEFLKRPDALVHERKVAGMLEELLGENQSLERHWASNWRLISRHGSFLRRLGFTLPPESDSEDDEPPPNLKIVR